ncbi:hypothetical protein Sango_2215300 [Sesamum angolense]|uniref:DUF8003 domain-containing protein n=1 Tax=Sesamum angolense TaxID=2727404 RepID=A0AAE1W8M1_9LAMI|nr:hypothetical protein Sango_2215300 [Sesamum angolense]
MFIVSKLLEVNGSVLADGGDGGVKGGGGSGGSIYIKAYKMIVCPECVNAIESYFKIDLSFGQTMYSTVEDWNGQNKCLWCGYAGGGGGRVSVDIFSRHDEPVIAVHGGSSLGCPENAGAAGTFYDAVPRSLTVSNNHKSTYTDTLLMDFPQPFLTNVYIRNQAKAAVPLLWSRVQVQGQISLLSGGVLSFGLAHYSMSEFELLAEELLMSDSVIRVFGALRMSVKMFLMWNSRMLIDGGGDENVETSSLEASNLIVLRESSLIHSNANLGVHGQGLLNLSGPGDCIEAQRLVLSLFYSINIGPGSVLRGPLRNSSDDAVTPKLYCDSQDCPAELLHPPEDCNVNSSLSFTLQVLLKKSKDSNLSSRDILVEGFVEGSVVHFHRARTISVQPSGIISTTGMGCHGGIGQGIVLSNGLGSGGGHGGKGGMACYNDSCIEGGISYGDANLPCELGSGSGNDSLAMSTAGGGIWVLLEQMETALRGASKRRLPPLLMQILVLGWIWWYYLVVFAFSGPQGGLGADQGHAGENGTVSGKACPKGLYGIFCEECPAGTYKNVTGSDRSSVFPVQEMSFPTVLFMYMSEYLN